MISWDRLTPEARTGLYLNIDPLMAEEDVRFIMATGTVFGGKDGNQYMNHLLDSMWWSEPETAEGVKESVVRSNERRTSSKEQAS